MAQGPCLNPNCKSHGMPHPNCRCHPEELAEGGTVTMYCAKGMPHKAGCEYFAEGGDVQSMEAFAASLPDEPQGAAVAAPTQETPAAPVDDASMEKFAATLPDDAHGTPGEMVSAAIEGGLRGVTAGLSDVAFSKARGLAEQYSDDPDFYAPRMEDVEARKIANPNIARYSNLIGLAGSVATGVGAMPVISKGAKAIIGLTGLAEASTLATRVAAGALTGAIEAGMFQGGDEISKSFLGEQGGDPDAAVSSALANVGGAALLGGALGGAIGTGSHALKQLSDSKLATKTAQELENFGLQWKLAQNPEEAAYLATQNPEFAKEAAELAKTSGGKLADHMMGPGMDKVTSGAIKRTAEIAGGAVGKTLGGGPGAYAGFLTARSLEPYLEKMLGQPLRKAGINGISALVKVLSSGDTAGVNDVIQYANKVSTGQKMIKNGVDSLFKGSRQYLIDKATPREDEKLQKFIDEGGIDQEVFNPGQESEPAKFAEGGNVQMQQAQAPNPIATHFPAHNMLINANKSRMSNYLSSLKPAKGTKMPFDTDHADPQVEKKYKSAISIANRPLSVMNHIKDGTLSVDQVKHLSSMYPELHTHLSNKITERVMNAQLDDEKPSYKTRQAMSLFIGQPLDSTMTPTAIQSAQMTFQRSQQQRQQSANSTKSLDKGTKGFQTPQQANERRDVERAK